MLSVEAAVLSRSLCVVARFIAWTESLLKASEEQVLPGQVRESHMVSALFVATAARHVGTCYAFTILCSFAHGEHSSESISFSSCINSVDYGNFMFW